MKHPDRVFFMATSIFFLLTNLIGFGYTLNSRVADEGTLATHIYVHGLCAFLWILLYFVQTTLIASNNTKTHMLLGKTGAVVLFLVLLSGFYVAFMVPVLYDVEPPFSQPGRDFSAFLIAVVLGFFGLLKRKSPFVHKRLMMTATLILSSAGIARFTNAVGIGSLLPGPAGIITLLFVPVIALIIYDLVRLRRLHIIHLISVLSVGVLFVTAAPFLWGFDMVQSMMGAIVDWLR